MTTHSRRSTTECRATAIELATAESETGEPQDRRAFERSPQFFVCWYDGGTRDVEACIEDVSDRGVFVQTRELPQPGDKLQLLIQGTRRNCFEAEGSVVWTTDTTPSASTPERAGFGFEFFDVEGFRAFLALCRTHTSSAPPSTAKV